LLLLAGLAAGAALAEGIARLLPAGRNYGQLASRRDFLALTRADPQYGIVFIPHADGVWDFTGLERVPVRVGFRTVPVPGLPRVGMRDDPPDPAARTIIALGDSFTFGAAVERPEIWVDRIEARHPGLNLVNVAQAGGLAKLAMIYEAVAPAVPHHAVIYEMWLGNEFWDNWMAWRIREGLIPGLPDTDNNLHDLNRSERIALHSKLYFLLTELGARARGLFRRESADPRESLFYEAERLGFQDPRYGNFTLFPRNKLGLAYCLAGDEPGVRVGMEETRRALAKIKGLAGGRAGGRLLVILFPFKEQVYFDLIRDRLPPQVEIARPDRIVMGYCRELDINCVDLLPALRARRERPLYWDYDPHFRPWGQEAAADEIEKILSVLGWLEFGKASPPTGGRGQ